MLLVSQPFLSFWTQMKRALLVISLFKVNIYRGITSFFKRKVHIIILGIIFDGIMRDGNSFLQCSCSTIQQNPQNYLSDIHWNLFEKYEWIYVKYQIHMYIFLYATVTSYRHIRRGTPQKVRIHMTDTISTTPQKKRTEENIFFQKCCQYLLHGHE